MSYNRYLYLPVAEVGVVVMLIVRDLSLPLLVLRHTVTDPSSSGTVYDGELKSTITSAR